MCTVRLCSCVAVSPQLDRVVRSVRGIGWIHRWLFLATIRLDDASPLFTAAGLASAVAELTTSGGPEGDVPARLCDLSPCDLLLLLAA